MPNANANADAFNRLVSIMDELRDKCPWDKKTNDSVTEATYH